MKNSKIQKNLNKKCELYYGKVFSVFLIYHIPYLRLFRVFSYRSLQLHAVTTFLFCIFMTKYERYGLRIVELGRNETKDSFNPIRIFTVITLKSRFSFRHKPLQSPLIAPESS
jgi:hypothetical protein